MANNIRNIPNKTNYIQATRYNGVYYFDLSFIPNNFVVFCGDVSAIYSTAIVLIVFSYGNYHFNGQVVRAGTTYSSFKILTASATSNPARLNNNRVYIDDINMDNALQGYMIYW